MKATVSKFGRLQAPQFNLFCTKAWARPQPSEFANPSIEPLRALPEEQAVQSRRFAVHELGTNRSFSADSDYFRTESRFADLLKTFAVSENGGAFCEQLLLSGNVAA